MDIVKYTEERYAQYLSGYAENFNITKRIQDGFFQGQGMGKLYLEEVGSLTAEKVEEAFKSLARVFYSNGEPEGSPWYQGHRFGAASVFLAALKAQTQ